jgi:predicted dehydrogenase
VGILGLGHWYSAYGLARAMPEYARAELVAAAWPDRAQLDEFCGTFHVAGHDDYRQLIARDDIDIVFLAPPVSAMAALAVDAARAGKHMVLGKPMAMTNDEAARVVEAVGEAGVQCLPFQCIMRLQLADLRARIAGGLIGDLILMHETSRWSIAEDWYSSGKAGWFADPRHVPGGALIDEGIYSVDWMRWLAGSEIVEVEARTGNLVHKDIAVEDWGLATFTFENGIVATLEAGWTITAPRKTGPSPKQNAVVRFEAIGTRGEVAEQAFRSPGRAILAAGAQDWAFERKSSTPYGPAEPFPLAHLIDCLDSGGQPIGSVEDARRSFNVCMAAYESARTRRPVRLTW